MTFSTPQITMYSTPWCGYCYRLKAQLGRAGIDYDDIDITHDPAAAARVESVNRGNQTVPTLFFSDGSSLTNPSLAAVVERVEQMSAVTSDR